MVSTDDLKKVCHDLRTPLAVIQGFLRLVETQKSLNSESQQLLEAAKISLGKIKATVDTLDDRLDGRL